MPDTPVPWVGLVALAAMFLLPYLPDRFFEGPRTSKHWPHRHVCGGCGAPWTDGHTCGPAEREAGPPLWGELRRAWAAGPPRTSPQGPDSAVGTRPVVHHAYHLVSEPLLQGTGGLPLDRSATEESTAKVECVGRR